MRLLPITRAHGLQLARDIPAADPRQMPLLRAGAKLTDGYIKSLGAAGIHALWVHDALTEGIEPKDLVPPHVREQAARQVNDALDKAGREFDRRALLSRDTRVDLAAIVDMLVKAGAEDGATGPVPSDPAAPPPPTPPTSTTRSA